MQLANVLGIARSEARTTRRLVRYWVFLVLSFILVVAAYVYYAVIHGFFSSYSGSVGSISPKYLISGLGLWGMVLFVIGLIFLAFDVRSRDERERIVEVIESRPCTNLEIVAGRYLGLLFMVWWPLTASVLVAHCIGWLGQTFDWPFGETLEPWGILGFVVLMAIPALTFAVGLVFLLSLVTRNRLVAALATLAVLGLAVFLLFRVPFDLLPMVDVFGGYSLNFPSEMLPEVFAWQSVLQRAAFLAMGLGLLALAAVVHPRLDSGRRKAWAAGGAALLALAIAGLGVLYRQAMADRARFAGWVAAHEAKRDAPAPDFAAVRGAVTIDPGRRLSAELEIDFAAPPDAALERAILTLNPGLEVEQVTDGAGAELEITHAGGLLEVVLPRPLAAGESSTIALRYGGEPQVAFAFLDGALQFAKLKLLDANIALLGYNPAAFHRRYVALLPAIRWLPAAGADVGRDDPERRRDFFRADFTVDLPEGWLAAGPGRRRAAEGATAGRVRYRFAPPAPLPEVGLVAARFASRSTEVAGIELEILLHPKHTRSLEVFDEAGEEIRAWLEERFREAADLGLPYPYDALTMVEAPTTLRAFAGGWRMDTAMAPPGLLLVKESSFPTTRFDTRFRKPEEFEDREGGIARAKREVLESFFEGDFNGGNIFLGAARNFFLYQTASHGKGSLALDFVCHDLANRLATGKQGFFSAHIFGPDFQQFSQKVLVSYLTQRQQGVTINDAVLQAITDDPEVWEQALGVALADMDPWEDPERAVNVLALKGDAMSRWILDGLGRDRAGELLATLRTRAAGRTFDQAELMAVAEELGIDFAGLAGDWLTATELPGFTASEPRLFRLPDEDGVPRYQLALHLRNHETAPGLLRLRYTLADGNDGGNRRGDRDPWQESEPVRVAPGAAVEVGLVLSKPPRELRVAPYLSLNRDAFAVALPTLDEEKLVEEESFSGARASEWRGIEAGTIVVDDLDEGFSIELDEAKPGLRLGGKAKDDNLDQGLPVLTNFQPPGEWSRLPRKEAWGEYRHTLATIKAGEGAQRAVFTTEVPRSGPWRLELHMLPSTGSSRRWARGTYNLTVEDTSGSYEVTFDAAVAEDGWNVLDELEIAAGEVRVALSDKTDGKAVLADAIRWRPVGSARVVEEEEEVADVEG